MWIFNTVKFRIIEWFILFIWYEKKSQEWSHIKYEFGNYSLIIPKHKEISRWTLNNIFKIIAFHKKNSKKQIENIFLDYYNKLWKK
jgi:hypothetical protein